VHELKIVPGKLGLDLHLKNLQQNEVTLSSPCLWASCHPLSPRAVVSAKERDFIKSQYEMLKLSPQRKEILLNLSMKCWNSAFDTQSSRLIIVVVQLGAVKIYVAAVEALRKKGKTGWRWNPAKLYHQNWWFSEFHPLLNANVLFCRFFCKSLTRVYDQTQGSGAVFFLTLWITLLWSENFPWQKGGEHFIFWNSQPLFFFSFFQWRLDIFNHGMAIFIFMGFQWTFALGEWPIQKHWQNQNAPIRLFCS